MSMNKIRSAAGGPFSLLFSADFLERAESGR
jgi:hypothetical protein